MGGGGGGAEAGGGKSSEQAKRASKVDPKVAIRKHILPKRMYCFFHCRGKRQAMVFILLHSLLWVGSVRAVGEPEFGPSGKAEENEVFSSDDRPMDVFRAKSGNTVEFCRASNANGASACEGGEGGVSSN